MLGGAGGEGAFVLAFTMSLEYSGVAERVPGLPWVTYSTFLANMISENTQSTQTRLILTLTMSIVQDHDPDSD